MNGLITRAEIMNILPKMGSLPVKPKMRLDVFRLIDSYSHLYKRLIDSYLHLYKRLRRSVGPPVTRFFPQLWTTLGHLLDNSGEASNNQLLVLVTFGLV